MQSLGSSIQQYVSSNIELSEDVSLNDVANNACDLLVRAG
jgi:hypothetical protein